jgi:hypothetical protein
MQKAVDWGLMKELSIKEIVAAAKTMAGEGEDDGRPRGGTGPAAPGEPREGNEQLPEPGFGAWKVIRDDEED